MILRSSICLNSSVQPLRHVTSPILAQLDLVSNELRPFKEDSSPTPKYISLPSFISDWIPKV